MPRGYHAADTRLRHQSKHAARSSLSSNENPSVTLAADGDEGLQELVPRPYSDFVGFCHGDIPLDERYLSSPQDLDNDITYKIQSIAEHHSRGIGGHGGPAFHFRPPPEAGCEAWPDYNGTMDFEVFKKKFIENPDAMYQEMKLRTIALVAPQSQVQKLHHIARAVDMNNVTLPG